MKSTKASKKPMSNKTIVKSVISCLRPLRINEAVEEADSEEQVKFVVTDEQIKRIVKKALTTEASYDEKNPVYIEQAYMPLKRLQLVSKITLVLGIVPYEYNYNSYERKGVVWPILIEDKTRITPIVIYNWSSKTISVPENELTTEAQASIEQLCTENKLTLDIYKVSQYDTEDQ